MGSRARTVEGNGEPPTRAPASPWALTTGPPSACRLAGPRAPGSCELMQAPGRPATQPGIQEYLEARASPAGFPLGVRLALCGGPIPSTRCLQGTCLARGGGGGDGAGGLALESRLRFKKGNHLSF